MSIPQVEDVAVSTKEPRKRAADFLDDDTESARLEIGGRRVRSDVTTSHSLTADRVNGAVENGGDENVSIATAKKPKTSSMMAEAERTQDQELVDEFGSEDESDSDEIDAAPALLAGFDSDNDDLAEDKDFDAGRVAPIPQFKKTSKKLRKAKDSKNEGPGAVYVGRIPHGFYEPQMREYFSQFGTITRLRLSRNKKTGASKHFAFIEFESDEVAKIVAETMDNYLMFGHILKCKYAPTGTLHSDVWKGANKKFRKIPHHKIARVKAEQPKSEAQIKKKLQKERQKRVKKAKMLKALGYEYNLPDLRKPQADGPETELAKEKRAKLEEKVEGALVPPPTVPKDELAVKIEESVTKEQKKSKKAGRTATAEDEKDVGDSVKPTKKNRSKNSEQSAAESALLEDQQPPKKAVSRKARPVSSTKPGTKDAQLKGILKKPKRP